MSPRWERAAWVILLMVPTIVVVVVDVLLRGAKMGRFNASDWALYGLSVLESLVIWGTLLLASSAPVGRIRLVVAFSFVVCFGLCLGGQAYFFDLYGAYLGAGMSKFATNFRESVLNQVLADAANYLSFKGPAFLLALVLVLGFFKLGQRLRVERWTPKWLVPTAGLALFASLFIPVRYQKRQPGSLDMLYMNAMGAMVVTQLGLSEESHKQHPRRRAPLFVPKLSPRPARPRNVVLVLLESVRLDATCNSYDPRCKKTAATNALFPERVALSNLRALDSCTAISMAVLYSGLGPHESRDTLHTWPFLFDYAKAAGYQTGYFTSQNILFGSMRLWLPHLGVDHFFSALDVDPDSDIDMGAPEKKFSRLAISRLAQLEEPFFLTLQLSNGHYPYFIDENEPQPFLPAKASKAPEDNEAFFNYYQNAIHQQDRHLAEVLRAIMRRPSGKRTVIVTTSDHGEAFREHHQMGHTLSVFDEELLVPGWIHAPPDTLDPVERQALESHRDRALFHPDLSATVLDLLGLWNIAEMAPFRSKMLGISLLSGDEFDEMRVMPLSNCTPVWTCAFENWGVMRGRMKLSARQWDERYRCFNLALDPDEKHDLGEAACGDLSERATRFFGRLPGKK